MSSLVEIELRQQDFHILDPFCGYNKIRFDQLKKFKTIDMFGKLPLLNIIIPISCVCKCENSVNVHNKLDYSFFLTKYRSQGDESLAFGSSEFDSFSCDSEGEVL
jgi:hypothetical protein